MSPRRTVVGGDVRALAMNALQAVRQQRAADEAAAANSKWRIREATLRDALSKAFTKATGLNEPVGNAEVLRVDDVDRVVAHLWGFTWWTERIPRMVGDRLIVAHEVKPGVYAAAFLGENGSNGLERLGMFLELLDGERFGPTMTPTLHGALIQAPSLATLITEVAVQAAKLG